MKSTREVSVHSSLGCAAAARVQRLLRGGRWAPRPVPVAARQPGRRGADRHYGHQRDRRPHPLPAAQQVGRPGLHRARVELRRIQQGRGARLRLPVQLRRRPLCRIGLLDPGPCQHAACGVLVQSFQMPQPEGGAYRRRHRGQRLVQGEFFGAADPREEPQAPDLGQGRRSPKGRPSYASASRRARSRTMS
ncbi:hypothetical protein O1L68_30460 [Streptomyces lydicus]|nr:hypothetical protein [Streptomyces lydicus]